jgi:hypothetical protein
MNVLTFLSFYLSAKCMLEFHVRVSLSFLGLGHIERSVLVKTVSADPVKGFTLNTLVRQSSINKFLNIVQGVTRHICRVHF